jgi:pilus assembly protein CpaC
MLIPLVAMIAGVPARGLAADGFETVRMGQPNVDLNVSEGRLLHFDGPLDSVFIADPAIADLRVIAADVVYVYGKKAGQTNLIALTADKQVRASVQFRVTINAQPANAAMHTLQPTTMTEMSVINDRVAVAGRTRTIEEARDAETIAETYSPAGTPVINRTTIEGSQQVNIRVRFAEVSRTEVQSLGFNWRVFGGAGASTVGLLGGRINVEVLLEAMRKSGVLNILAEPNLTAITGQTANFLAGGELPVPIAQPGGTMGVIYKPFGVSLDFTPTIIATNRIALHVRPQVSAVAPSGGTQIGGMSLPAFTVRRADTTVEVASGETFAIAGLFQRQMSEDFDKLPGLGEVPVLSALFSSEHFRRNESELVILITPYLVKPVEHGRTIATPLDKPGLPAPAAPSTVRKATNEQKQSTGLIIK